jgi:Zn finger protein HypA/HybF involved in hydrogenase expression
MKLKLRLSKIGNGYYLYLPKAIKDALEMEEGEKVLVDIKQVIKTLENVRRFRCKACQHSFHMEADNAYCPACNGEDLEILE